VQYTRRLALTEAVARTDPMPPMLVPGPDGQMELAPFAKQRDLHSPNPMQKGILGVKQPENPQGVPLHPDPMVQNYQQPTSEGRQMLSSYARYVLRQPHPTLPDAKPVRVKIYRVQHRILLAESLARGADPRDWMYYLPYYQGTFDSGGKLLDPHDPFLYWLLPIVHQNADDLQSPWMWYVFKHAGEQRWIRKAPPEW
jgi:hypothetical protein